MSMTTDAYACRYVVDGTDTDGTVWNRCLVHDELAPSNEAPCSDAGADDAVRRCPECDADMHLVPYNFNGFEHTDWGLACTDCDYHDL